MDADATELRVLGSLIEKQRLTPDVYPLTLNALRLACNQSTNRDPVVEYDIPEIRAALERLSSRRWVRLAGVTGGRTPKYRHLLDEALDLSAPELALLCVLMLRGEQTPGELKARSERLHPFAGRDELERTIERLVERRLAARRERRPGQKEERYAQLLGGRAPAPALAPAPAPAPAAGDGGAPNAGLEERVERLEQAVEELRLELGALRAER